MDSSQHFEILVRRKVAFLSSFVFGLLTFFFAIFFLFYLYMLPTMGASGEMGTVYYIVAVPDVLKNLSAYSGIGLLITVPLYYSARLHKPAILRFHDSHLSIVGKQIDLNIPFRNIQKVFCNELHNAHRQPKDILQFVLQQKDRKVTSFRLKHHEQSEELLAQFAMKQNMIVAFYEDEMVGEHHHE